MKSILPKCCFFLSHQVVSPGDYKCLYIFRNLWAVHYKPSALPIMKMYKWNEKKKYESNREKKNQTLQKLVLLINFFLLRVLDDGLKVGFILLPCWRAAGKHRQSLIIHSQSTTRPWIFCFSTQAVSACQATNSQLYLKENKSRK